MTALDELLVAVPASVAFDPDLHARYRRDSAAWGGDGGEPWAISRPASTAEVQALARWATRHRIRLVPRGAGTGVAGGAEASAGCVVVSFERMTRIVEVDADAMIAVVQPGVLNVEVKNAAREVGLWYPPDPSSFEISTIGGNVATNAGGLCCVKYGVTANYVLGLEVVLADGSLLRTGGRTRKDVAGYDLTRLVVGSEGTLGFITEITLRLRRPPPPTATLVATFSSLEASGRATAAIVRVAEPSMLELMDRAAIRAVETYRPQGLDVEAAAMLIVESDAAAGSEMARIQQACDAAGATLVVSSDDEAEGQCLRTARRLAYPALEHLGTVLIDDVAVPLPRLPDMLRRIEAIAATQATQVATVAHAGDGNLHPLVVFDAADAEAQARAEATFDVLMAEAIALGGTITGEHGVGTLKRRFLQRQLGPVSLALHARIRRAFDPECILNPGKVFEA
ncbi:MAG TPA: FAD-linked oxidase C-terminal domain-containing protein [Polyangiaceae bacterium]|jgi:glycolate oxidase